MVIVRIYKKTSGIITNFLVSEITLDQIKLDHELNTVYYLEVKDTDDKHYCLNLSLLILETSIGKCQTWTCVLGELTERYLIFYSAVIPNLKNPHAALFSVFPLSSPDFKLSYLDQNIPEERNIRQLRYKFTDLAITKTNPKSTVNLENCICSVNGLVSRPIMFNDELLMKNGAKFMTTTDEFRHPSIVLFDFTKLGGFEIVPFSDCRAIPRTENKLPSPNADMKFILPEHVDLTNKTIFPVVGHSLFLPDTILPVAKRSIILSPYKFRIGMSLLKKAAVTKEYIDSTYVMCPEDNVKDYLLTTMMQENHFGAFFVIVNNPNIWIQKTPVHTFHKSVLSSEESDSFLLDTNSQSFLDYTKIDYESLKDIYCHPLHSILEIDTFNHIDKLLAVSDCKCTHVDIFKDYGKGHFYMIRIVSI